MCVPTRAISWPVVLALFVCCILIPIHLLQGHPGAEQRVVTPGMTPLPPRTGDGVDDFRLIALDSGGKKGGKGEAKKGKKGKGDAGKQLPPGWYADYDQALARAKRTGQPLLVLFH